MQHLVVGEVGAPNLDLPFVCFGAGSETVFPTTINSQSTNRVMFGIMLFSFNTIYWR